MGLEEETLASPQPEPPNSLPPTGPQHNASVGTEIGMTLGLGRTSGL